jgi:hypothetical protein
MHDSTGISLTSPVVIQFSEPMNTESVEGSFAMRPRVNGAFSWSPTHDAVTFTPQGSGFPAKTMIEVCVADTARAAGSCRKFCARFESRFKTEAAQAQP